MKRRRHGFTVPFSKHPVCHHSVGCELSVRTEMTSCNWSLDGEKLLVTSVWHGWPEIRSYCTEADETLTSASDSTQTAAVLIRARKWNTVLITVPSYVTGDCENWGQRIYWSPALNAAMDILKDIVILYILIVVNVNCSNTPIKIQRVLLPAVETCWKTAGKKYNRV